MTFAQRRNRLMTHFTEGITIVKRRISVLGHTVWGPNTEFARAESCSLLFTDA